MCTHHSPLRPGRSFLGLVLGSNMAFNRGCLGLGGSSCWLSGELYDLEEAGEVELAGVGLGGRRSSRSTKQESYLGPRLDLGGRTCRLNSGLLHLEDAG